MLYEIDRQELYRKYNDAIFSYCIKLVHEEAVAVVIMCECFRRYDEVAATISDEDHAEKFLFSVAKSEVEHFFTRKGYEAWTPKNLN